MPQVTYVAPDGTRTAIDVAVGESVMQGALDHGVEGIAAECGGGLACATCHCYVDPAWADRTGSPSPAEDDMLEAVAAPRRPTSRLSCQIEVTEELDGLVVDVPDRQY